MLLVDTFVLTLCILLYVQYMYNHQFHMNELKGFFYLKCKQKNKNRIVLYL